MGATRTEGAATATPTPTRAAPRQLGVHRLHGRLGAVDRFDGGPHGQHRAGDKEHVRQAHARATQGKGGSVGGCGWV